MQVEPTDIPIPRPADRTLRKRKRKRIVLKDYKMIPKQIAEYMYNGDD